jgi:hypothetical protein
VRAVTNSLTRFTCTLTAADEPACQSCARVRITDSESATARGCPRHADVGRDVIERLKARGLDNITATRQHLHDAYPA